MSMLRLVLRKINVMHNSLIKFWSVRKSNEVTSLNQSIVQTKAKLQLDEAGRISTVQVWFFSFIIFFLFLLWLNVSELGHTFWGSWWVIFLALLLSLVVIYIYTGY